jgi:hypothetical protein
VRATIVECDFMRIHGPTLHYRRDLPIPGNWRAPVGTESSEGGKKITLFVLVAFEQAHPLPNPVRLRDEGARVNAESLSVFR